MSKKQQLTGSAALAEDHELREVFCHECKKPIPSIPSWLSGAKVKFECERCRQMHPRVVGIADMDGGRTAELDPLDAMPGVIEPAEEEEEETEDDLDDDSSGDSVDID